MKFWHMQLNPGETLPNQIVEKMIEKSQVIGLDIWPDPVMEVNPELQQKPFTEWTQKDIEAITKKCKEIKGDSESCGEFKAIRPFLEEMAKGDIVYVHNGSRPIGLVKVEGDYDFVRKIEDYPSKGVEIFEEKSGEETAKYPWFRHFRKVKLLDLYHNNKDALDKIKRSLPKNLISRGTLGILKDPNRPTYIFIKEWLNMIEKNIEIQQTVSFLKNFGQIILYGPPGTGKTYRAKELAARILGLDPSSKEFEEKRFKPGNSPDGAWEIVQFHPSYNYEDFVRGISVTTTEDGQIKYEVKDRIFVEMCREAANNPEKPYILIIDEINRANLAAVLGELIYALEYRGEPVRLPYGVDSLKIPANLYIIGTMNTADRSIGHIDYAVRRRFAFVQVLPDKMVITKYYNEKNLEKVGKVAEELFDKVEKLFKENGCLSPDYHREDVQPGHSYFLAETADKLALKFAYQVWPLLKEYCKDGVLLCENKNCEIKISDKSFSLKEEVKPEKLVEAINNLTKGTENEGHKEGQKETPPAS